MKLQWKPLLGCCAIPFALGGLAALLTAGTMQLDSLEKPPLTPPSWLFPVVWSILYLLMGLASYLIFTSGKPWHTVYRALAVYALQLAFQFVWPILFFQWSMYFTAFLWLIALWGLIAITAFFYYPIRKSAAFLLLPYLLWVSFAGYLNFGIWLLNP